MICFLVLVESYCHVLLYTSWAVQCDFLVAFLDVSCFIEKIPLSLHIHGKNVSYSLLLWLTNFLPYRLHFYCLVVLYCRLKSARNIVRGFIWYFGKMNVSVLCACQSVQLQIIVVWFFVFFSLCGLACTVCGKMVFTNKWFQCSRLFLYVFWLNLLLACYLVCHLLFSFLKGHEQLYYLRVFISWTVFEHAAFWYHVFKFHSVHFMLEWGVDIDIPNCSLLFSGVSQCWIIIATSKFRVSLF